MGFDNKALIKFGEIVAPSSSLQLIRIHAWRYFLIPIKLTSFILGLKLTELERKNSGNDLQKRSLMSIVNLKIHPL